MLLLLFPPDLSTLTSLRSSRFPVRNGTTILAPERFMISLRSLPTLPPLAFTLTYEIHPPASPPSVPVPGVYAMEHFDWGLLEARLLALSRPPTHLHIVVIPKNRRNAPRPNINRIEDTLRSKLPELDARGLLSFQLGEIRSLSFESWGEL